MLRACETLSSALRKLELTSEIGKDCKWVQYNRHVA